jgi:ribosome-binding factor A
VEAKMKKKEPRRSALASGPTQRQLRAGENIRHLIVEILARDEIHDPQILGASITVGEVRMSPDLRHANIFVSLLGDSDARLISEALNRAAAFIRGRMAKAIDSKFTPKLKFIADSSYDFATHIDELLAKPHVLQDLERKPQKIIDDKV